MQAARPVAVVRRHDLDRLRVAACLLLFPFHTLEVFDQQPAYHIKSASQFVSLEFISRMIAAWHMPLFFLLAGMAAMFVLERQPSLAAFVGGRIRRLLTPLILGLVTIAPAIKYLELRGGRDMSHSGVELVPGWTPPPVFDFYVSFFSGLEVFSWSHLWFLVYLIVLTTSLAPVFAALHRLAPEVCPARALWLIWLPLPLLVAIEVVLRPVWGDLHNLSDDWANISIYVVMMIAGAAMIRWPVLEAQVERQWRIFAVIAVGGLALMLGAWDGVYAGIGRAMANWGVIGVLIGAQPLRWIASLPGEPYLVRSQLSVYVLHHLPLVALAYWLCDAPWPVALRFAAIMLGSIGITFAVYHVAIRPFVAPRRVTTAGAPAITGVRS
ncbi:MAG: acyltransferase family protein [Hyphomicrobiaceae bacterium]